jgi:hypothetical protein
MAATPNLQRKLQQTLGADAAGDLVAWMQGMDAHRTNINDLRGEMQVGFARIDGRLDTMQERTEKLIEKGLREQTKFFFLAWSVILAAIVGLYSR